MTEDTRKLLKQRLEFANRQIVNTQYKIDGGRCIYFVGMAGVINGMLLSSPSHIISGMVVGVGGIIYKFIYDISQANYNFEKESIEYGLKHPESVIEFKNTDDEKDDNKKGGKHFKK